MSCSAGCFVFGHLKRNVIVITIVIVIFHESDTVLEASNYIFTTFDSIVKKKNLKTSIFFIVIDLY